MDLGLSGKTAVITGGSGVIGQGLVLGYAAEGVNVISASRDLTKGAELEQEARDRGFKGRVLAVKTDITDRASIDAMMATCHK
ncbi:MAG: SDR family NAD(P)-dependent oxidoreductase, partial [Sphingomonadales bacterium]